MPSLDFNFKQTFTKTLSPVKRAGASEMSEILNVLNESILNNIIKWILTKQMFPDEFQNYP